MDAPALTVRPRADNSSITLRALASQVAGIKYTAGGPGHAGNNADVDADAGGAQGLHDDDDDEAGNWVAREAEDDDGFTAALPVQQHDGGDGHDGDIPADLQLVEMPKMTEKVRGRHTGT